MTLLAVMAWLRGNPRLVMLGALVIGSIVLAFWLYSKGGSDERERLENEANKARIEHLRGAKETENEIESLDDDDFGSAIDGLPRSDATD